MEAEDAEAWPGMMAHPFNPSTWQAGAKTEFKDSQAELHPKMGGGLP